MTQPTTITLNDGHTIPQLGFGVWRLPNEDTPAIIKAAVDAGYRHIDTAQGYDNEEGVGTGIGQLDIPRDELFITSKERTGDQGYESTLKSFDGTMKRLMLETLDLFLIHWPAPRHDRYVETWKAFVDLQKQGRVRSIGVSNFLPEHIERIIKETGVRPAVNQIELHPYYQQRETREWLKAHDIAVECYSPIGGEGAALLKNPVIQDIAGLSTALLHRW
nr:aldo/keto reductase [Devosia oryzisoli]